MRMVTGIALALLFCCTVLSFPAAACERPHKPLVQLAILLDTSNSMDGLIHQAKAQLWKIVNEFVICNRGGHRPEIQVALYEYGNDGLPPAEGHIRQVLAFTTDLDKVSEKLFALKTNGGSEYCGQVIQVAGKQLQWSENNNDLKVIVIAGNEPFDQGSVDYRKACRGMAEKGIIVNTIHCGDHAEGERTGWLDGARLADGQYMSIDQNKAVVNIDAPQDAEISRLGAELNSTYVPYGARGGEAYERQAAEDSNAASVAKGSMTQRAFFKSSGNYRNDSWDLVDAVQNKSVELDEVAEEALPADLRTLSVREREKVIADKAEQRKEIQKKIQKLNAERTKYVAKKEKEMAREGEETLDSAMIKAVRKQAADKAFEFE